MLTRAAAKTRAVQDSIVLKPDTILVLGPAGAANRTARTVAALRRYKSETEVAYVDTSQGLERAREEMRTIAAENSYDCVLCYDVSAEFVASLLDIMSQMDVQLIALGSAGTQGVTGLAAQATQHNIRIMGPNAYGPFIGNSQLFINPLPPSRPTGLAVLTQSGNVTLDAVAELRHLAASGPAFAWGLGNGTADLGLAEAVTIAANDPDVTAVAVHGEGFTQGRAVLRAVASAARRKPVVLLQGGTSDAGRASALSHTGNLSTSKAVTSGAFLQAGAEVVGRSDEFVPVSLAMSLLPDVKAANVAVIADGGGQATLMVDALAEHGIGVSPLPPATVFRLKTIVGGDAHIGNPLDVGSSPVEHPTAALAAAHAVLDSDDIDCVLVVGVIGSYALHFDAPELAGAEETAVEDLAKHAAKVGKALIFVSSYAEDTPAAYQRLWENGVPVIGSIDIAARTVRALQNRSAFLTRATDRTTFPAAAPTCSSSNFETAVLDESGSRHRLEEYGLQVGQLTVTSSADEAAAVMQPGKKYVLKIVSPDISHKSDVGGVRLNVSSDNVVEEFGKLTAAVKLNAPEACIGGISVAPMAMPGVEMIVGAYRDPIYGPCIAVGSGGVLAELIRDTVVRVAPVTLLEAEEMIQATMSARLLDGYRGSPPADQAGLARLVVAVGEIVAAQTEVQEIDLNPVIVSATCPQVADARVVVRE